MACGPCAAAIIEKRARLSRPARSARYMPPNATPVSVTSGVGSSGALPGPVSRFRQPGFWSAIAGMALALTIACVIVATELISQYGHRATHFQRKMDRLQAKISQLQTRLAPPNPPGTQE